MRECSLDAVVFGGGVAGLWALNVLDNAGYSCALIERTALGDGQTIQSQGIIHGGIKYALPGKISEAFIQESAKMPERWGEHLAGREYPDLSAVVQNSRYCYLWVSRTEGFGLSSWLDSKGVAMLNTKPEPVAVNDRPPLLRQAYAVYRVAEPVIDTASLLQALGAPHTERIVYTDKAKILNQGKEIYLEDENLLLRTQFLVLAAGKGNAELALQAGIEGTIMRTRPLKQLVALGDLPELYAHCIDGCVFDGRPDHTITTHKGNDCTVWNIGGRIAEGELAAEERIAKCRTRLKEAYPDTAVSRLDFFDAIRAEPAENFGRVHVSIHGNIILAFPMKLSMTPVLGDYVIEQARQLGRPSGNRISIVEEPLRIAEHPWSKK